MRYFKNELDRDASVSGELTNAAMKRFFTRSLVNSRQVMGVAMLTNAAMKRFFTRSLVNSRQVMGVAMNVNTSFYITTLHAAVSTGKARKLSSRNHKPHALSLRRS